VVLSEPAPGKLTGNASAPETEAHKQQVALWNKKHKAAQALVKQLESGKKLSTRDAAAVDAQFAQFENLQYETIDYDPKLPELSTRLALLPFVQYATRKSPSKIIGWTEVRNQHPQDTRFNERLMFSHIATVAHLDPSQNRVYTFETASPTGVKHRPLTNWRTYYGRRISGPPPAGTAFLTDFLDPRALLPGR
jgi:hypothetical protein